MIGTVWVGRTAANAHVRLGVVDVRDWWNGFQTVRMVYARRLDGNNRSEHPQGTVRKVSVVGVFCGMYKQEVGGSAPARRPGDDKQTWTGRYDGQLLDCRKCGGEGKQRAKTGAASWRGVCNDCYRQYMHDYNRGLLR